MSQNPYYDQLITSEPLGFIDPFEDLGTFDA
ncbi:modification methylase Sau96I, partial [Streptococcus canis]